LGYSGQSCTKGTLESRVQDVTYTLSLVWQLSSTSSKGDVSSKLRLV